VGWVPGEAAREAFYDALLDDDPQELYDRAPCGYLSTTPDGTVIKVNQTFLNLTGHERGDLLGKVSFADLLTPGGRIYHETHYAPMLRMQESVREIALELVRADGTRLPVLVNAALERTADGSPVVVRVAVFDATERRQYERELLRAKERAEESEARASALARTLQQTLIPPNPPDIPGLVVAAVYRPAGTGEEVGGDFYDVFQVADDDWVVVLGDVCGKGVEAAVVTALVRHTLRAVTVGTQGPARALARLNRVLLDSGNDRFCTVALLRLRREQDAWRVTASTGGHPRPLLVGPGQKVTGVGGPGSLVGVLESVEFTDEVVMLEPGASLVLFTDGVTEGRRRDEFYGEQRLVSTVSASTKASAAEIADRLLDDVVTFQEGRCRDDVAIVVLQVAGDERP